MNKPIPFGKYFLLERINVGGMAEVFKAKTVGVEGFERIVALKRILPSIAEDEEFITMFIDEAKIAVQLQHANIAQIFDLGKVEDSYFIALEYVNGRDLRGLFDDLRKRDQAMPMTQVCYIIMQLCEGLDYAHNKRDHQGRDLNLVHRDVSPQNVLIGYDGEVKLIDFGIAKAAGKASKTQAGILKGKFGYMSPEQVRGLPIDRRSDIFAMGIVLYEMLTGERLFIGESDFSTLEKVRNVDITPPSSINSEIPEKLERIVLKSLEKNVEDRYQNAIDLHDDLQLFLHSVGRFSSRKDLSAWMKRSFGEGASGEDDQPVELEELEEVETIEEPTTAPNVTPAPTPAHAVASKGGNDEEFGWDEEELETQIFDKDPVTGQAPGAKVDFQSVTDDKTVTGAPPDSLLAELGDSFENAIPTRPTNSAVPSAAKSSVQPVNPSGRKTHTGMGRGGDAPQGTAFPSLSPPSNTPSVRPTPLPSYEPPKPAFRQTLMGGMQAPAMPIPGSLPNPSSAPSMPSSGPAYPTLQPMQGMPMPGMPFPGTNQFPGVPVAPQPMFPQPAPNVDFQRHMTMSLRTVPSKIPYYVAFILFMLAGAVVTYMYLTRPGKLQVVVRPPDSKLSVDGVRITSGPPYLLQKRSGTYRLTLVQDGYITREQSVQISPGQEGHIDIDLEPSPETGFDLTSQPSGGLVWLDGQPLAVDETGKQAVTNFHASRIPPGRHVIEIRGNQSYKDWRQEFFQEPNRTVRLHADLEAAPGAKPVPPVRAPSVPPSAGTPSAVAPKPDKPVVPRAPVAEKPLDKVDDIFENPKPTPAPAPGKKKPTNIDDVFETEDKLGRGGVGSSCTASISSKPWAEVSIDGKPTGKVTPLVDYPIPCGTHRITFKNSELMIERNESVTLKPGRPFKKTFSLVENEL